MMTFARTGADFVLSRQCFNRIFHFSFWFTKTPRKRRVFYWFSAYVINDENLTIFSNFKYHFRVTATSIITQHLMHSRVTVTSLITQHLMHSRVTVTSLYYTAPDALSSNSNVINYTALGAYKKEQQFSVRCYICRVTVITTKRWQGIEQRGFHSCDIRNNVNYIRLESYII